MDVLERVHERSVYGRRVRTLAAAIADLLPPRASVLDIGAGDGAVAAAVREHRPDLDVHGLDVLVRPDAAIAVEPFDGGTVPYPDDSWDAALLVDVVHHAEDGTRLLAEAARIARSCVVLKDHLADRRLARPTLRFMDRVGNRRHGVSLPYVYWTRREWEEAFDALGLDVTAWTERLPLYPWPAAWLFGGSLQFLVRLEGRRAA